MGRTKRYLQLTTVMAAKHRANAHRVPRMRVRVAAGRLPNCHANTAAKMDRIEARRASTPHAS